MQDLIKERCGENFVNAVLGTWQEALQEADHKKLEYFLQRAEQSPQAEPFVVHAEDKVEHLLEFVWKLALYAPEEWYEVVSGLPRPAELKNDFKVIGVAFDASSRLRRAGIDHYHWKLTAHMAAKVPLLADSSKPAVLHVSSGTQEIRLVEELPPTPPDCMRVVAISDTHLFHEHLVLPPGDLLVHGGDISFEESRSLDGKAFDEYRSGQNLLTGKDFYTWFEGLELAGALRWLSNQKGFPHKVLVGGNHDYVLEQLGPEKASQLCVERYGLTYLHTERQPTKLLLASGDEVCLWGSGLSFTAGNSATRAVASGNGSFQLSEGEGAEVLGALREPGKGRDWVLSPKAAHIIVTHSPPKGCLLNGKGGEGAEALGELVKHVRPALYICGHAHKPQDLLKECHADLDGVPSVNAACLGTWNHLHGLPVVVDVPGFHGQVEMDAEKQRAQCCSCSVL
mmetsp:Transcript_86593/g.240081  ORF Transcript_86593/g.240081 Transcript_86593/m.240081 type:complete len:454 (+) Transcript_86593:67-1428(+)